VLCERTWRGPGHPKPSSDDDGVRTIRCWLRHSLLHLFGLERVFKELVAESDEIRFHAYGILHLYLTRLTDLERARTLQHVYNLQNPTSAFSSEKGAVNGQVICPRAVSQALSYAWKGPDGVSSNLKACAS
jgi:hypothetical protein